MNRKVAVLGLVVALACVTGARNEAAKPAPKEAASSASPRSGVEVSLASSASRKTSLHDRTLGMSVAFALRGAADVPGEQTDAVVAYARALGAADLTLRRVADGVEDSVAFATRPAIEEVVYDVELRGVAGLRVVASTVEMLDARGTPRLRMASPWVLTHGDRFAANVSVEACSYDASPAPPWDRPVTPAGSDHCVVRVSWSGVAYPAVLDPVWSATGGLSIARNDHVATLLQSGRVVVIGGGTPTAEVYDPQSGTFATSGAMPDNRVGIDGALLSSGKVLVVGDAAQALVFDPVAGTFSTTGSTNVTRYRPTATVLSTGKVLVAGGVTTSTAVELYDPNQGTFGLTGSLSNARSNHTATRLTSGKVLIVGGSSATSELYDATNGTFSTGAVMSKSRSKHTATLLQSGKVLVTGGASDASAEIYDPGSNAFAPTGSMSTARSSHAAAILASGKVIVAGGEVFMPMETYLSSTELYDPASGVFGAMTSLPANSIGHSATTLANGNALVAGGNTQLSQYIYQKLTTGLIFSDQGKGGPCTSDSSCAAGLFCVDSVCCQSQCSGQCEACDVPNFVGTCTAISGVPHGTRAPCANQGTTCGGTCSASNSTQCTYTDAGTSCGTTCANATTSENACDGQGHCTAGATASCPGNFACNGATACKTSCTLNVDCAPGYTCQGGTCVVGGGCIDVHTGVNDAGSPEDCTPFKCDTNGRCKRSCASVADCVAPAVCGTDSVCKTLDSGSSGCAIGGATRAGLDFGWVLFAAGMVALRRRRSSARAADALRAPDRDDCLFARPLAQ